MSDWYVILLNEIDEALTARKLPTRIVFIEYYDTNWAPLPLKIAILSMKSNRSVCKAYRQRKRSRRRFCRLHDLCNVKDYL